ncbi:MAG: UDP-N-acetylmuramoyl-tripeptide--D-alanyl-D-alanine ligase [Tannerella sp.]|jgi:UDP-N-acetylmuramoyl-tripeptide--D-alanyl-D-alanine ligase|nr:UDP-N-acetylmuramoyl-tripeptide--D-alanyl-D-alanine ligase [Tannerella sp.]
MTVPQLYKLFTEHPAVTTDSRNCIPDSIFFALKGNNFDGNCFAEKALQGGCFCAVIDNPDFAKNNDNFILVDDVLHTLQQLARLHRETLNTQLIAITGTNGKTTTKELTAAVLAKQYNVLYTQGNRNNHIGVPLTLLELKREHEFAVIEMGASHEGEIKTLCRTALPDYGLITNVGIAHLEGFGSFEGVIKAKGELYDFLRENGGMAFVHQENKYLTEMACDIDVCLYGTQMKDVTFVAGKVLKSAPFLEFEWFHDFGERYTVKTALVGDYNLWNALAAISVGLFLMVDAPLINAAISEYKPANNRSQFRKTPNNELIVDAYNANPDSMSAALRNFSAMQAQRKAVILGDMLELGDNSCQWHLETVAQLNSYDKALLCGKNFSQAGQRFLCFEDTDRLADYLRNFPLSGYTVLIKGSRAIQLEKIIELL